MSILEELLRGVFAIPTGGISEMVGRHNTLGKTVTGGLEGGAGGFISGGPLGAGMGAATGAGLSGTGTTDPYKLKGGGINFGSGLGAGGLTHLGALFGSGGAGHASAGATESSPTSQALQMMRSMPGGGQQQPAQPSRQQMMQQIYQMYPNLRPNFGGFNGA